VMMHLAETLGHEQAHSIVAHASTLAVAQGLPLGVVLQQDGVLPEPLEPDVLAMLLDPDRHLGLATEPR
jgi:adenylosuccinate lyase